MWQDNAECHGADVETFFSRNRAAEALTYCAACSVITECRELADIAEHGISPALVYGIFGGETGRQRTARRGLG